jgi:hypothetical protein
MNPDPDLMVSLDPFPDPQSGSGGQKLPTNKVNKLPFDVLDVLF